MTIQLEHLPTAALIPYARNARTHSEAQVNQIAASIDEFGFTNPVLIDADNGIIAGHGRVMAAGRLGLTNVPCIRLSHLTDAQKRAYILADNQLALNAGWDEELLRLELLYLQELDFNLDLIGFDDEYLSKFIGQLEVENTQPPKQFNYQEKYAVLIECPNEAEQEKTYNRLMAEGYKCRVLVN